MHKILVGLLAAVSASAASAAINIDLGNPAGDLGTDHTYTTGAGNVVASGYSAPNVDLDLYGKNLGGNEQGLGLTPTTQNEIPGPGQAFIQLNVSDLFGHVSGVDFFMNSSTSGEAWAVCGTNTDAAGCFGSWLVSGTDEGSGNTHPLPNFGQYDFYNFYSLGTIGANATGFGNVLIGGLTLNSSVPEPATWAMMLIGFGAMGFAFRRRRTTVTLPQLA